jgi:hypothetical protein
MVSMRSFAPALLVMLTLAAPAGGTGIDPDLAFIYREMSLADPTPHSVTICHGFGCKYRTPIAVSDGDRKKFIQIMAGGRASPAAEREAVAAAVAWFQRRVAPEAGTAGAVARAGARLAGERSQFDCIDSSRNTTSTLLVLEQMKLLRYHRVRPPESRGYLIDLRLPHATAVLHDRRAGRDWAVDSWTHNNGEKPDVMPLSRWLSEGG